MDQEHTHHEGWTDPIVAEVRTVREELLAAAHYDLQELCEQLRVRQESEGRSVVQRAPRRAERPDTAA